MGRCLEVHASLDALLLELRGRLAALGSGAQGEGESECECEGIVGQGYGDVGPLWCKSGACKVKYFFIGDTVEKDEVDEHAVQQLKEFVGMQGMLLKSTTKEDGGGYVEYWKTRRLLGEGLRPVLLHRASRHPAQRPQDHGR